MKDIREKNALLLIAKDVEEFVDVMLDNEDGNETLPNVTVERRAFWDAVLGIQGHCGLIRSLAAGDIEGVAKQIMRSRERKRAKSK